MLNLKFKDFFQKYSNVEDLNQYNNSSKSL